MRRTHPCAVLILAALAVLCRAPVAAGDPPYVDQTRGTQQVLVVFMTYPDKPISLPTASAWTTATTQLRDWMATVSYGKAALQFTLVPTLGVSSASYASLGYGQMHTDARNFAASQGFVLSQYHRVWLGVRSPISTGLADLGGSRIWIDFSGNNLVRHEFGHTFGTNHPTGWDDSLIYAPARQRTGWLTETDTQGFKVVQQRTQGEVRGLYDLVDSESTAVVPGGLRGIRVHSDNVFTYGGGNTIGLFVAMIGEKLYHFAGDNMTTNGSGRYFLNPGESHLQDATVFTSGSTKGTAQVRIQYLRSSRTDAASPFRGVAALSVAAPGQTVPTAGDDRAATPAGTTLDIPVLANDGTGGAGALELARIDATSSRGGTVAWVAGQARYTPPAGFSGIDTFTYIVTNGGPYALGTVAVAVGDALGGELIAWEDFESCGYAGGYGWAAPWTGGAVPIGTIAGTDGAWAIQLSGGTPQTLSRVIDLDGAAAPRLRLRWRANNFVADLVDKIVFEMADGGVWTTLREVGNTPATPNQAWHSEDIDLAAFAGRTDLTLRMRLVSPSPNFRAGQVDSIAIVDAGGAGNAAPQINPPAAAADAGLVLP